MSFRILYFLLIAICFSSCRKTIKAKEGAIDIYSNIYFNASKGLDEVQSYHISRINFRNDTIIELIPDFDFPQYNHSAYLIIDSSCYDLGAFPEAYGTNFNNLKHPFSVFNKETGAIFTGKNLPNYEYKRIIKDTILFGKHYLRFEIYSPEALTRYYVHPTDTILPYTIYSEINRDYKGRIERVDSYDKINDIFVTLQLVLRNNLDAEAEEIFEFNGFVGGR